MPNWIEGTLKLRGKRDNIRKFFNEGLEPSSCFGEERPLSEFITDDSSDDYLDYSFKNEPHIKGTRRAFITGNYAELYKEYGTVCVDIKQAWSFDSNEKDLEAWKEIAKKYSIDLKLFGIECGMEFCQELIILHKEDKIIENVTRYENWEWDCPFPRMGG